MTVVKGGEVLNLKVGENPPLEGEAKTGYVSPDDEDGETDSEKPSGAPQLKKGPWTLEEDKRLKDYVEAHGEGNWNKVQRNARLNRCGKSCRLRWANHLRPDLKKGPFDPEEIDKIVRFHFAWGPKWAKMASHLPGRTDNEIKNFWNIRIKKTEKQGLPVYPEHVLSQVKQPQKDMNCETPGESHGTPGESHGKKRLREYSKEKVIEMHDLMDDKMSFQHLDYHKDPVVPTKPLKRRASTGSLQISGETKETFCSTDLNYVLARSQSVPTCSAIASGYPVELPLIQSSSYTLSNDWLLQCVSASVEQQIHNFIQSLETISSQTTGLLPTKSGRSFEIPIPMVYPMIHSFGDSEHESSPNTDIQAANLSLGSDAVFDLSQYYQVASFSDPGVPDTQLGASFFNDTQPEASILNGTPPEASFLNGTPLEASFLNNNWKDQSHLYCQEPKPLTDGGQWFDPCHKPRSVSSSSPLHNQGHCNNHD